MRITHYYQGRACKIIRVLNDDEVVIQYTDNGRTDTVRLESVQDLPPT